MAATAGLPNQGLELYSPTPLVQRIGSLSYMLKEIG
jgi:hypothetical protein